MASIVIIGAGIGGMSAAYEIRALLGQEHRVTVVGEGPLFSFTPSNPWVAVGWRKPADVQIDAPKHLGRKHIAFEGSGVQRIEPAANRVLLGDGRSLDYDYLVIATGPRLAFDEVPGLGPEGGYTQSVCTTAHAASAWDAYQAFLKDPGPIVIGAAAGASCFGPAYEFAMILDADLRKRKLRDRVPMTYVSPEPYIGHMGLGGVGDSKGLMESEFRQRHIQWIVNARIASVADGQMTVSELDADGQPKKTHVLPFRYSMVLPAFTGVDAVRQVEGLGNPRGFVLIDEHQRHPAFANIYGIGVCVAIPPVEVTPVPTGAPKTGFMIESMVTAVAENIKAELEGRAAASKATWNAICLADMGDTGVAFVALPQIPPRNVTWAKAGKWVHLAKVAFEKYFLMKMKSGNTEPVYEKYVLKLLGILRTR
ncbi:NAD(P)/FAD-dependent oxidoreductase [Pseudoxanthomonas wuyuanensis]|uniref:Sulfide-quinone reductase n=1 Tax=Pseudoxanthomonas wuyuanensis TaxID=1073196 RepID=A0A286CVV7_9GAMM|nr:FAD/NAD(P)-binding oxidoreductase [Pseudoxanthomonas wuyuanensis]KAF1721269.1 NAD(P)/FAD-dependent oxidoreductase [Pseudoxanthomonas wuyuanensis]SOD50517.1 sulfide-quinone oxidoreductase [Pseudoxanthomonas wuyuanensis]